MVEESKERSDQDWYRLNEWQRRKAEANIGEERFVVAGLAGGLVATLGLSGTLIGLGIVPLPRIFFWLVVVFVAGLVFAYMGRCARAVAEDFGDPFRQPKPFHESIAKLARMFFFVVSTLCAGFGITFGLVIFYYLTE